ncbi:hypothetical protein BC936DRAFT_149506 [Jimgerdemannia flammicorona]|uniref:Uncharacterized protein n=2 Tax=Jimgerdemannia flammicorona TaxID=994334 RepID=A0A433QHP9_9FUNG|nr:hypothetical protein BC936DRAFT_149506 [Jimgerdemannia flammicorona]RUS29350.1 hypothetical protein BC938DRAFT_480763 [Jimgerdemannia flammicorona]
MGTCQEIPVGGKCQNLIVAHCAATLAIHTITKTRSQNPASSNGMPTVGKYRTPAPGSPIHEYVPPVTKASAVYENYYFQRDTRRNYPRLAVYTQQDVAGLLAGAPVQASLPVEGSGNTAVTATTTPTPSLTEVLTSTTLYSKEKLPPAPVWGFKYQWKESTDAPKPDDGLYWPMKQFS